ncbi:MAG: hypothetical protein IJ950_00830, partial [Helicobacter sp.]|nr:hypothetical protein [Helicobacter sp.]
MIRIFGYGVTTKPLVRFLNSLGIRVAIYDDTFEGTRSDEFGNTLLDSALFSDDTIFANSLSDTKPIGALRYTEEHANCSPTRSSSSCS